MDGLVCHDGGDGLFAEVTVRVRVLLESLNGGGEYLVADGLLLGAATGELNCSSDW